jgi:hypothetical protein
VTTEGRLIAAISAWVDAKNAHRHPEGLDKMQEELLDVALSALAAWEHVDGNRGRSMAALSGWIASRAERAGVQ